MEIYVNNVLINPYIAFQGVKWQRNDVDGPNAGRTLDGTMVRDRVGEKDRLDITCRPLLAEELSTILQLINPVFVTVRYTSPLTNTLVTKTMYSNNVPATFCMKKGNKDYWMGVSFPLIER